MTKRNNLIYSVLAILLLAIVALIFFAPADFEGKVLQQHDMMQGIANGQEAKAFQEQTGETTRWTNSLFSGMPTFQIAPSYPANGMMNWVAKLYTLWLPSPANLLFSMMLGFFIMCLCMKMKWHTALFGAVAWGFSSYFIIIIGAGHIWKFLTLSYIPPMIGGMALCYRGKYLGGAALTALFAALQLNGNHLQMTYYFLFVAAALVIAWLIIALKNKSFRQWIIATLCVIGAGGLGVLANLSSLHNSYEYSKETMRGKATELVVEGQTPQQGSGLDHDYITAWSYGIDETMTLLIPNIKGGASVKPIGGENMRMSTLDVDNDDIQSLSEQESQAIGYLNGYYGLFGQYFGDQPMTNGPVYVGAFVLMLAILAMFVVEGKWESPLKWCLFAVSILAVLLAWGHNFDGFTTFFINNVPLYNKFRTPSSILVIVEFTIPLLATLAIIKMIDDKEFMQKFGTTFYTVMGVGLGLCFIAWVWPSFYGSPWSAGEKEMLTDAGIMGDPQYRNIIKSVASARLSLVSADGLRSLLFILLGAAACWLYMKRAYTNKALFVCSLTAIVLIDLFSVNRRYVDNDNFVTPYDTQVSLEPTETDLIILQDTASNYRVMDADGFQSARSSYFHKTIGGYHAAKLTRYQDLINRQLTPQGEANPRVLNMLNAKYIISQGSVIPNDEALGNAWFVDKIDYVSTPNMEMAALDTINPRYTAVADRKFEKTLGQASPMAPTDTVYETSYAPNKLTYKAISDKGGVAVFSEVFFPWGWEATIDGNPAEIGRVNYVLRALRIPAGSHDIAFTFDPKSLKATNAISVVSMSVIYLLCLLVLLMGAHRLVAARKAKETKS